MSQQPVLRWFFLLKYLTMEISAPYKILLSHLDWNIRHLKEILKYPKTIYYRDASIQRFGFTFNLTLKCLKTRIAKSSRVYSETEDWFLAAKEVGLLNKRYLKRYPSKLSK